MYVWICRQEVLKIKTVLSDQLQWDNFCYMYLKYSLKAHGVRRAILVLLEGRRSLLSWKSVSDLRLFDRWDEVDRALIRASFVVAQVLYSYNWCSCSHIMWSSCVCLSFWSQDHECSLAIGKSYRVLLSSTCSVWFMQSLMCLPVWLISLGLV